MVDRICHRLGAERHRGLDQLGAHRAGVVHDQRDEEEDHADEEQSEFRPFARAEPHQQQRDEGWCRQIAPGADEWIEEGIDATEGAHQHPKRNGDSASEREARDDAVNAGADVVEKAPLCDHRIERGEDLVRRRHEQGVDPAFCRGELPQAKEDHPDGDAECKRPIERDWLEIFKPPRSPSLFLGRACGALILAHTLHLVHD